MALIKVKTNYGTVAGVPGEDARFSVFKGIPYAKAPTGRLRFMPPENPDPWEDELLCDKWSDSPVQDIGRYTTPGVAFSEDCLKLNIWTPAESCDEKLPVMIFFYGGGYNRGDSCYKTYDGEAINRRGVIHVNVNYRVSVMGYLALPELSKRSELGVSGNYGLLDQIQSIRWIRENIAAFGGDPDNITIFGQSAGAGSCRLIASSPLAQGLFKRAIIMSGCGVYDNESSIEDYQTLCSEVLARLGWTADDLLSKDASEVQNELNRTALEMMKEKGEPTMFFFRPCVDGCIVPGKNTSAGLFRSDLDVMLGSVYGDGMRGSAYADRFDDPYKVMRAYAYAPQVVNARRANDSGKKPLYTYFIERVRPADTVPMPHGAELPYFFGTLDRFDDPWTAFDRRFCDTAIDYWTNFAKCGDPNGAGLPVWKPYTKEAPYSLNVTNDDILVRELAASSDENYILDCLVAKKEPENRK